MPWPAIRNLWPCCVPGGTRSTTRRASLGRHRALAAAHGTGAGYGEAPLAKRDRPPPFALGTRRDRRARRRPLAAARRADFAHGQHDRHLAPQRGHAERNGDGGLDLLVLLTLAVSAPPAEDRREEIAQPPKRPEIRKVEVGAEPTRSPCRPRSPRPPGSTPPRAPPPERTVLASLVVLLALRGVAQDVVRLAELLEALGRLTRVG